MPLSIAKKQQLNKTARKNVNVTRTNKDGSVDTLKNGSTADCTVKHPVPTSGGTVGVALGITKNMGDFESLRVDTWASLPCEKEDFEETFDELREIVGKALEETVEEYV